ncbi:MAG: 30S ribosomal protein THX [Cyclobacteriaceae bacterium]|nr:30S ribosomal protein THX [Cyclobacteriaceae bacterium]
MGKGDKKSKKGKRWKGSYGVSRSKNSLKARMKRASSKKVGPAKAESKAAKPKKTARKKADA